MFINQHSHHWGAPSSNRKPWNVLLKTSPKPWFPWRNNPIGSHRTLTRPIGSRKQHGAGIRFTNSPRRFFLKIGWCRYGYAMICHALHGYAWMLCSGTSMMEQIRRALSCWLIVATCSGKQQRWIIFATHFCARHIMSDVLCFFKLSLCLGVLLAYRYRFSIPLSRCHLHVFWLTCSHILRIHQISKHVHICSL